MNTRKVLNVCFVALTLASVTIPAFAAKTAPSLGKAKAAQTMKIKCSKARNTISAKDKTAPVVGLKKSK